MMIGVMEITHVEKVVGVVRVELEAFGDVVGEERVNPQRSMPIFGIEARFSNRGTELV